MFQHIEHHGQTVLPEAQRGNVAAGISMGTPPLDADRQA